MATAPPPFELNTLCLLFTMDLIQFALFSAFWNLRRGRCNSGTRPPSCNTVPLICLNSSSLRATLSKCSGLTFKSSKNARFKLFGIKIFLFRWVQVFGCCTIHLESCIFWCHLIRFSSERFCGGLEAKSLGKWKCVLS